MTKLATRNSNCLTDDNRLLRRRLQRGGAWIVGGRTTGMAVVLGSYVYLARILPTEGLAAYVLVSSMVVFFSVAAMFGLNTLACRYVSESIGVGDAARAGTASRLLVRLGAVSIATAGFVGWLSAKFLGEGLFGMPELTQSAGLIALWVMLLATSQILAETFRGLHDLRMASLLGGVSGGFAASAIFLASVIGASCFVPLEFSDVVLIAVAALLMPTGVAAIYLHRTWPRHLSPTEVADRDLPPLTVKSVVCEAFPVMLVQLFSFGLAQMDIWMVGAYCSDADLAIYGIVRRVSLLVAIPLTQISLVVGSSIAELYARGDRQGLQRMLQGAATVSIIVTFMPVVALLVAPEPILEFIFGAAFRIGANPLRVLLLGQMAYAMTGPCGPALMMTGHQRVSLCSLIASMPVFLIAPWAATHFGLSAVALVFAIAACIQNLMQWAVVWRLLGVATHPCLSPRYIISLLTSLELRSAATAGSA